MSSVRSSVEKALEAENGILRLEAAWVARDFLPPGRRLGLPERDYGVGDRGFICERWLASTTTADNMVPFPDEGLSFLALGGEKITLKAAVEVAGDLIMGSAYASTHRGLGRLAKIYDFGTRIFFHLHPKQERLTQLGKTSKEEAYYFPAGEFTKDELLVSHSRATAPIEVENNGIEDLMLIKFFGPDINLDVPMIPRYGDWKAKIS